MRVIQFLEPVKDDFIGPFSSEESAKRWLAENDRSEKHVIHHLVDPAEAMFGPLPSTVDTLRIMAERDGDVIRVTLLEFDISWSHWSVIDIGEHADLRTIIEALEQTHELSSKTVLVQENDGTWSEPDAITLLEALEATL